MIFEIGRVGVLSLRYDDAEKDSAGLCMRGHTCGRSCIEGWETLVAVASHRMA